MSLTLKQKNLIVEGFISERKKLEQTKLTEQYLSFYLAVLKSLTHLREGSVHPHFPVAVVGLQAW